MRIDQVLLEVLPEVSNVTEAGAESDETDTGEAAADSVDQDAEAEAGNA
jgi:hypothetical protein